MAGEDFDPLTIPKPLPFEVPRVEANGHPTEEQMQQEIAETAWMQANTANTNTRLTLVSDEVDGAYAAISTEATTRAAADSALASQITTVQANVNTVAASVVAEATARVDGDTALASSITTVSATANSALTGANNATANGQIYFAAKGAPAGATASYGLFLTAGGAYAGFEAIADSVLGSAIGISSDRFFIYDTSGGTRVKVLEYAGGEWILNGNVTIQSANGAGSFRYANGNIVLRNAANQVLVEIGINL